LPASATMGVGEKKNDTPAGNAGETDPQGRKKAKQGCRRNGLYREFTVRVGERGEKGVKKADRNPMVTTKLEVWGEVKGLKVLTSKDFGLTKGRRAGRKELSRPRNREPPRMYGRKTDHEARMVWKKKNRHKRIAHETSKNRHTARLDAKKGKVGKKCWGRWGGKICEWRGVV